MIRDQEMSRREVSLYFILDLERHRALSALKTWAQAIRLDRETVTLNQTGNEE
jgi:hypothetical protein